MVLCVPAYCRYYSIVSVVTVSPSAHIPIVWSQGWAEDSHETESRRMREVPLWDNWRDKQRIRLGLTRILLIPQKTSRSWTLVRLTPSSVPFLLPDRNYAHSCLASFHFYYSSQLITGSLGKKLLYFMYSTSSELVYKLEHINYINRLLQ